MGKLAIVVLLFALITVPAHATLLTWNLVGVTFQDGTSVTGSFQFDADAGSPGTLSSWSISVLASTAFPSDLPAFTYSSTTGGFDTVFSGNTGFSLLDSLFSREFDFVFTSPLSDAGGTIALDATSVEFVESTSSESRNIAGGSVTSGSLPVPEPATMVLAGGALLGLGLLNLRRRRRP